MTRKKTDPNAPLKPLSSYNLFCRSIKCQDEEFQKLEPKEKVKFWSTKWASLSEEEKKKFVDESKRLRIEYEAALQDYQKTPEFDRYQKWHENQKTLKNDTEEPQIPKKKTPSSLPQEPKKSNPFEFESDPDCQVVDFPNKHSESKMPIFTHLFLDFNQQRENNLRNIRKEVAMLEEECALLSKHIDLVTQANERSENELIKLETIHKEEEAIIKTLKQHFISAFSPNKSLPDEQLLEQLQQAVHSKFTDNPDARTALLHFLSSDASKAFFI
ncbi:High mobility group protein 20A [Cichlidogyrus casuarinus]|uniref:High mobility group protein 20A n=1 Tax=Cichlidogyrus casuarinus TaxID=1844966 RepID=A0ABD2Q6L3_9PLAT